MSNGTLKYIQDLSKGDRVMCNSDGATAEVLCLLVMSVHSRRSKIVELRDGLIITAEHPILINGDWVISATHV